MNDYARKHAVSKSAKLKKGTVEKFRKTFFNLPNAFDPIYHPKTKLVQQRLDKMCLKFDRTTQRCDHDFLGIPKASKRLKPP